MQAANPEFCFSAEVGGEEVFAAFWFMNYKNQ